MRGLTLTELMIVIVVLGILAAVAYPSYRDFAARAKRNEARAMLLQIATNQERFYLNNNGFTGDLTNLGFPVSNNFVTETGSYNISIAVPAGNQTYTATATYLLPDPEGSTCGTFTIRENGVKGSGPATDCWTRTR
jgi:type IV pilus assembly protein PilE